MPKPISLIGAFLLTCSTCVGTLIIAIPTEDGFVVGGDGMRSVGGQIVETNVNKINFVSNRTDLVFAVTGTPTSSIVIEGKQADGRVLRIQATYDTKSIVASYLSENPSLNLANDNLSKLGERLKSEWRAIVSAAPSSAATTNSAYANVVLFHYDKEPRLASIRSGLLEYGGLHPSWTNSMHLSISLDDPTSLITFGAGRYLQNEVLTPPPDGKLAPITYSFLVHRPPPKEVPIPAAVTIITNLIRATELNMMSKPPDGGYGWVGGRISVYLVDGKTMPRPIFQHASDIAKPQP